MKEKKHGRARERLRRRAAEQRVAREPHYLERSPEREGVLPAFRRGMSTSGSFQPVQRVVHYVGSFPVPEKDMAIHAFVNEKLSRLRIRKDSLGKVVKLMVFPDGVKVFQVDGETLFMAHALMRIILAIGIREKQLFALVARNPSKSGGDFFCHCFLCETENEADELSQLVAKAFKLAYASIKGAKSHKVEQGQPTNLQQPQLLSNHHPRQLQRPGQHDLRAKERARQQEAERQLELERKRRAEKEREEEQRQQEAQRQGERRKNQFAVHEQQHKPASDQQRLMMAPAAGSASPVIKRRVVHRHAAAPATVATAENQSKPGTSNGIASFQAVPTHERSSNPAPVQPVLRETATVIAGSPRPVKMKTRVARSVHRKQQKNQNSKPGDSDDLSASKSLPCLLDSFQPDERAPSSEKAPVLEPLEELTDAAKSAKIANREKRNSLIALERAALELASFGVGEDKHSSEMSEGERANEAANNEDEEEDDIFGHEPESYEAAVQEALENEAAALSEVEWFHAGIPRAIAMEVLACQPPGVFMVRDSQSHQGSFALSLKSPGKGIIHYLIERTPSNSLQLKGEDVEFDDVILLIDAHRRLPGILPCCLSTANVNPALVGGDQEDGSPIKFSDDDDDDPDYDNVNHSMLMLPEDSS